MLNTAGYTENGENGENGGNVENVENVKILMSNSIEQFNIRLKKFLSKGYVPCSGMKIHPIKDMVGLDDEKQYTMLLCKYDQDIVNYQEIITNVVR